MLRQAISTFKVASAMGKAQSKGSKGNPLPKAPKPAKAKRSAVPPPLDALIAVPPPPPKRHTARGPPPLPAAAQPKQPTAKMRGSDKQVVWLGGNELSLLKQPLMQINLIIFIFVPGY